MLRGNKHEDNRQEFAPVVQLFPQFALQNGSMKLDPGRIPIPIVLEFIPVFYSGWVLLWRILSASSVLRHRWLLSQLCPIVPPRPNRPASPPGGSHLYHHMND